GLSYTGESAFRHPACRRSPVTGRVLLRVSISGRRSKGRRRKAKTELPMLLLPSAFYLLPSTFRLPPSAFRLLPSAFRLLPSAFYRLHVSTLNRPRWTVSTRVNGASDVRGSVERAATRARMLWLAGRTSARFAA